MAKTVVILVHLLLIVLTCESEIIVSDKGRDCATCLEQPLLSVANPCLSLQYVVRQNFSNVLIRIEYTQYTLNETVEFAGVANVTIVGSRLNPTLLTCTTGFGLVFKSSSDITLTGFTVNSCGKSIDSDFTSSTKTAILFQNCFTVTLYNMTVSNSSGRGLTFNNSVGQVKIQHSSFINNTAIGGSQEGGGILVILNSINKLNVSNYSISSCQFIENSAIGTEVSKKHTPSKGSGGGVCLLIFKSANLSCFETSNCQFIQNKANYGGGLCLAMDSHSVLKFIFISSNVFVNNSVQNHSGGGANLQYYETLVTHVAFQNNTFRSNNASSGGGIDIFMDYQKHKFTTILINKTNFFGNIAVRGSAININYIMKQLYDPYLLPNITVSDCKFLNNRVRVPSRSILLNGAVYTDIALVFSNSIIFQKNTGTALFANHAQLHFLENTQLLFHNNVGDYGGAITLYGGSWLNIKNDVNFNFIGNTASIGGALCILPNEVKVYSFTDSCFNPTQPEVNFYFSNNIATTGLGNDVFVSTLYNCIQMSNKRFTFTVNSTQLFTNCCIGQFHFQDNNSINYHVATGPNKIYSVLNEFHLFPGLDYPLNVSIFDELGGDVSDMFPLNARLEHAGSSMSIPHKYRYIDRKKFINITGIPGEGGDLVLETAGVNIKLSVNLTECPPCFIMNHTSRMCLCYWKNKRVHCYGNRAQLLIGYWIGRLESNKTDTHDLYVGACAEELCNTSRNEIPLPKTYKEIEKQVCNKGRVGALCTKCQPNASVYYLSRMYNCKDSSYCQYGLLWYLALELVPVTLLFLTILLLGIKFTSGALCSFLFSAQMLSLSNITFFEVRKSTPNFKIHVLKLMELFYGFFSMDITSYDSFEFCIINTNSILNLLMFKYLTILYAFLLIVMTIYIMRLNIVHKIFKMCQYCGRSNIRRSIVDGISAFLVICYVQCADTTIKVLNWTTLTEYGNDNYTELKTKSVHIYDGELAFITGNVLYILPAILCTIFILIPPPLILLFEPFFTKIFSFQYLSTNMCLKRFYDKLRLKLVPFLDSFQASFKDKHRYFAGLYFVYRIFRPLSAALFTEQFMHSSILTLALFTVVVVHILIRPHKKKAHNLVEVSMFLNLIFLFYLTRLNYRNIIYGRNLKCDTVHHKSNCHDLDVAVTIQLALFSLPIIYLFCYTIVCVYIANPKLQCCRRLIPLSHWHQNDNDDDFAFPHRLLSDESTSYRSMQST